MTKLQLKVAALDDNDSLVMKAKSSHALEACYAHSRQRNMLSSRYIVIRASMTDFSNVPHNVAEDLSVDEEYLDQAFSSGDCIERCIKLACVSFRSSNS